MSNSKVFECKICGNNLSNLARMFISTGISYRFLSEITAEDSDIYLTLVSRKLHKLSIALESSASVLTQFIIDIGGSFVYRDCKKPDWTQLGVDLNKIIKVHRETRLQVLNCLETMEAHGHLGPRRVLKHIIKCTGQEEAWKELMYLINQKPQLNNTSIPDQTESMIPVPDKSTTKDQSKNEEDQEEYNEELPEEGLFTPGFTSSMRVDNTHHREKLEELSSSVQQKINTSRSLSGYEADIETENNISLLDATTESIPQNTSSSINLNRSPEKLREELNLENTDTSKYTENIENTENTENTGIHDPLSNLYTDTLDPLSNLYTDTLDPLSNLYTDTLDPLSNLDSSVDHSFLDTDTETETRTINRYGISGRVVCIVCNEYSPAAVTARDELNSFLKAEGVYIIDEEAEHNSADNINNADKSAGEASRAPDDDEGVVKLEDVDLLICLGGDGTLLKCSCMYEKMVPLVIGFALGHENFLSSLVWDQEYGKQAVGRLLAGTLQYNSVKRQRLAVHIFNPGEDVMKLTALNEVTVRREEARDLAELNIYLDNILIYTTKGDGMIISTATGSTGYNFSAGGPILFPSMDCILITALCSWPPSLRPILVPRGSVVSVSLAANSRRNNVSVMLDYRTDFHLNKGGRVDIRISDFSLEQVISVAECKRGEHEEHVERDEHDEHNEAEVGPGLNSIQQIWISKLEKIKQ